MKFNNPFSNRRLLIRILCQLDRIETTMARFGQTQEHEMKELDDLTAQVAAVQTVDQSAITLLTGLKAQLDAAIASGNPAALVALSDSLGAQNAALAAAVAANTPAAPPAGSPTA